MVEVDGKSLRLTHLSKVMFPEDGFTKAELLLYYQTVAPLLLPHLRGRPLTLKAFPHGVRERPYYRRRLASTAPPWLSRVKLEDGAAPVVEDVADLLWVVNQDSVEIHPWLSRKENLNYPDLLVFDLDPGSRLPFQRLCEAATVVKEALDARGGQVLGEDFPLVGPPSVAGSMPCRRISAISSSRLGGTFPDHNVCNSSK